MRLARSFCEGLVPGVPRGLWPPEIMPDMLQGEPTMRPPAWLAHSRRALPCHPRAAVLLAGSPPGAQHQPGPPLSDGGCRELHQLTQEQPLFLA